MSIIDDAIFATFSPLFRFRFLRYFSLFSPLIFDAIFSSLLSSLRAFAAIIWWCRCHFDASMLMPCFHFIFDAAAAFADFELPRYAPYALMLPLCCWCCWFSELCWCCWCHFSRDIIFHYDFHVFLRALSDYFADAMPMLIFFLSPSMLSMLLIFSHTFHFRLIIFAAFSRYLWFFSIFYLFLLRLIIYCCFHAWCHIISFITFRCRHVTPRLLSPCHDAAAIIDALMSERCRWLRWYACHALIIFDYWRWLFHAALRRFTPSSFIFWFSRFYFTLRHYFSSIFRCAIDVSRLRHDAAFFFDIDVDFRLRLFIARRCRYAAMPPLIIDVYFRRHYYFAIFASADVSLIISIIFIDAFRFRFSLFFFAAADADYFFWAPLFLSRYFDAKIIDAEARRCHAICRQRWLRRCVSCRWCVFALLTLMIHADAAATFWLSLLPSAAIARHFDYATLYLVLFYYVMLMMLISFHFRQIALIFIFISFSSPPFSRHDAAAMLRLRYFRCWYAADACHLRCARRCWYAHFFRWCWYFHFDADAVITIRRIDFAELFAIFLSRHFRALFADYHFIIFERAAIFAAAYFFFFFDDAAAILMLMPLFFADYAVRLFSPLMPLRA